MSPILSDVYRSLISSLIKLKLIFRSDVRFHMSSVILPGNVFEGDNLIGRDSVVARSHLGRYSYISSNSRIVYTKVGRYCSIGDNVRTCLGRHKIDGISSHPIFFSKNPPTGCAIPGTKEFPEHRFLDSGYVVEIGSDVWIGSNVMISDGVRIGNGAVIGMGAVVTRDVDAYEIVVGSPARSVRRRFDNHTIERMLESKWWRANIDELDFAALSESLLEEKRERDPPEEE